MPSTLPIRPLPLTKMPPPSPPHRGRSIPADDWVYNNDSAGIAISSDLGAGKTNVIELLLAKFARSGQPFIYGSTPKSVG